MTFGKDFAFIGNQYHLEKFGEDQYIDLLFYNRELNALVAFELKMGDFKPAYLGQLSSYLRILDDEVRKPHSEQTQKFVLSWSLYLVLMPFNAAAFSSYMRKAFKIMSKAM